MSGILFFRKSDHQLASKLLSVTIFIVNLHLASLMVLDTNLDNLFPALLWIPYSYLTAIGPLVFLYTKALTNMDFRISKRDLIHFIPVTIELLLQGIQILYSINFDLLYYNNPLYFYVTPSIYICTAGSIFYYLRLSLAIINNHEAWALKNFSNLKEITLNWLHKLITYYRVLWIFWVPFMATFLLFFRFQLQYLLLVLILYLMMLVMAYLTFWIGLEGLGRMNLVFLKQAPQAENKNYIRLSQQEIKGYVDRVNQIMDVDKVFLQENLNLKEFAEKVKADPNLVSYILNTQLQKNFYEFINSYRIEEVKKRLNHPNHKHLTILGIALESGFNSKTSFNRVFKQLTGMTPSEFQRQTTKPE